MHRLISRLLDRIPPESTLGYIVRLFREMGRQYFWGYLAAIFFMVIVAVATAATAWILEDVVNQVFVDHSLSELMLLAAGILGISIARGVGSFGANVTLAHVGNAIVANAQRRMFRHLLSLDMDFYQKVHSSDLITRMSIGTQAVANVLSTVLTSLGRDLLSVIALVGVMLLRSPWLTLVALVIGPLAMFGVRRLIKQLRAVVRAEFKSIAEIIASVQETANGIRIVKAFNLEPIMRRRLVAAVEGNRIRMVRMNQIKAGTGPLMETLGGCAVAGVILWAGYAAAFANQPPGAFVSFIAAVLLAYEPAKRLANTRVQIEMGVVGVSMFYRIVDTEPLMNSNPDGPDLEVAGGEIVFDNVSFRYAKGQKVLKDLSFRAAPATVTALVGPSGGGKTTMINLIERFYDIESGTITIDGQDIAKVKLDSLRAQASLVSQDVVLFRATIRDNIRFGRPDATEAEIFEAAKNAMAHDFILATPQGYDTMIEDEGTQLSGGQRQRVAIARAMLRDAPILLLDEATSSLDAESESQVQEAFERLMRGRTTIVIAHRLATVINADRICVIVEGRIVEEGKHAELIAADSHYARFYHLQFQRHDRQEEASAEATAADGAMRQRATANAATARAVTS